MNNYIPVNNIRLTLKQISSSNFSEDMNITIIFNKKHSIFLNWRPYKWIIQKKYNNKNVGTIMICNEEDLMHVLKGVKVENAKIILCGSEIYKKINF